MEGDNDLLLPSYADIDMTPPRMERTLPIDVDIVAAERELSASLLLQHARTRREEAMKRARRTRELLKRVNALRNPRHKAKSAALAAELEQDVVVFNMAEAHLCRLDPAHRESRKYIAKGRNNISDWTRRSK